MRQVHIEIDDELSETEKLWRYMDLAKFISLLDKNAIWLARADMFRDKHEGRFPGDMRSFIEKAYEDLGDNHDSPVKDADDFQDYLQKNTFISCWHKNFDENMVMWEIYGRENNAVAIQSTVGQLRNNVDESSLRGHSLIVRDVTYQWPDEIKGELLYEECFFIKRPHFSFEQEVRVSLDTYSRHCPSKETPYGHELPAHVSGLIEKVLVHPDSPQWFVDVIESVTGRYKLHSPVERGIYGNK